MDWSGSTALLFSLNFSRDRICPLVMKIEFKINSGHEKGGNFASACALFSPALQILRNLVDFLELGILIVSVSSN